MNAVAVAEWCLPTAAAAGRMPLTKRAAQPQTDGELLLPAVQRKAVLCRNANHAAAEAVSCAHGVATNNQGSKFNLTQ